MDYASMRPNLVLKVHQSKCVCCARSIVAQALQPMEKQTS